MKSLRFYGFINNTAYRMPISIIDGVTEAVECSKSGTSCTALPEAKIFEVKVNLNNSEFIESMSNEAFCESLINWVKATKVKHIPNLSKDFKINLKYKLTDQNGTVIDEGSTASVASVDDIVLLFANTEEQEMGYRRGFTFDHSFKFSNAFPATFGIMKRNTTQCIFKIEAIQVLGMYDTDSMYQYLSNAHLSVLDNTGRCICKYPYRDATANTVVLFDTSDFGIYFDPIHIEFKPRELRVKVHVVLNNFAAYDDDFDLLVALAENRENSSSGDTSSGSGNNSDIGFISPGCGCSGITPPCSGNNGSSGNTSTDTGNNSGNTSNNNCGCNNNQTGCRPIMPPPNKEEIFTDNIVTDDELQDLKNEIKVEVMTDMHETLKDSIKDEVKNEISEMHDEDMDEISEDLTEIQNDVTIIRESLTVSEI